MANTIVGVKQAISEIIDEVYSVESKTAAAGWSANPAFIKGFNHARTGQVLGLNVEGMVDYDRAGGYRNRNVVDTWTDVTLAHDRAAKVMMDQVDLMDEAQVPTIGAITQAFIKDRVVPEVDATRVQDVCLAMSTAGSANYTTGYTPAKATILGKIDTALATIQDDTGVDEGIQILFNSKYSDVLKQAEGLSRSMSVKDAGTAISTKISEIDGNPVTYIPSARMYSELEYYAGTETGSPTPSAAGWAPKGTRAGSVTAKEVIAIFSVPDAIQAVTAHEVTKLFTADENPDADAAFMAYRTYHGAFVLPNKKKGVVVLTK